MTTIRRDHIVVELVLKTTLSTAPVLPSADELTNLKGAAAPRKGGQR